MKSVSGPVRPLPLLTELNTFFWASGADGKLRMQRCSDCLHWQHPAGVICPVCLSRNLAPQELSGKATVEAFTLNYQPWTERRGRALRHCHRRTG